MKPTLLIPALLLLSGGTWIFLASDGGESPSESPGELEPRHAIDEGSSREVIPSLTEGLQRESLATQDAETPRTITIADSGEQAAGSREQELRAENLRVRRQEMEAEIQRRSVRIADELGLATGAEQSIARVYLDQEARIRSISEEYEKGQVTREARTRLRESLDGIKAWRVERFKTLFGAEAAAAIEGFRDRAAIEGARLKREDTE